MSFRKASPFLIVLFAVASCLFLNSQKGNGPTDEDAAMSGVAFPKSIIQLSIDSIEGKLVPFESVLDSIDWYRKDSIQQSKVRSQKGGVDILLQKRILALVPSIQSKNDGNQKLVQFTSDLMDLTSYEDSLLDVKRLLKSTDTLTERRRADSLFKSELRLGFTVRVLDSSLRTQITDETAKSNDDIKTKVAPSEILKDLKRLSASALEADRELNSASQRLNLASTRLQLLKIDSALLLASTLSICERMNVLLNTDSMAGRIHHIVYKGSEYRIFITDTRSHILQIHPNETGAAVPLESVWKRLLKEKGLTPLMACNAGMYNENGSAVGLCISNRRLVTKMDTNTSKMPDNFHLYPNGVFYVDSVSGYRVVKTKAMSSILKDSRNITHATQSGPMLLIDGDVHPAFIRKSSNLNVRNGIGVVESSKSRKCVIAISDDRVNFHDFATLFKYVLRCRNALYLDGAISQMVGSDSNPTKIRSGGAYIGPVLSVSEKQSK